jgi:hypothetical protein
MADRQDKPEDAEKKSDISVNVGGDVKGEVNVAGRDLHVGDVSVGGDFVQGDKVIHGDDVHGDKITSVTINPFEAARAQLEQEDISQGDKEDAEVIIRRIEEQADQAEPEPDRLDRWLGILEEIAPQVVEVLVNAITNPGAAVGSGLKLAIKAWREGRKA